MNVLIKKIDLDDVYANDKKKYNTNNHWDGKRPDDYDEVLARNNTKHWISNFHSDFKVLTLDKRDLMWMNEAANIGMKTCKFSSIYKEDLDDMLKKYEDSTRDMFDGTKYFIRTDRVSLKNGFHGVGPYTNLKDIIESMVTSTPGHECFHSDDVECNIYLMKWIENFNEDKEFRVFVYRGRITALSQQHLYSHNKWLLGMSEDEIKELVSKIVHYFNKHIHPKVGLDSYVMDLGLIGEDEVPYFIEPNSFGKEYASGSSLFNWLDNYDELYNDRDDSVSFRYA